MNTRKTVTLLVAIVGLVIVGGWYVTGHLGFGENPETLEETFFGTNSRTIESLSFVAPVAYAIELLLLWSDKSLTVTFGIATTAGLILGSAAYALASRVISESFAHEEGRAGMDAFIEKRPPPKH